MNDFTLVVPSVTLALLLIAPNATQAGECQAMDNITADGVLDERVGVFAFPGAEGWARRTRGGAGGNVVIVNTLEDVNHNDDSLISLREALQSINEVPPGPRTIVFEVGGLFELEVNDYGVGTSRILMSGEDDSNVTVACQSAPSPGVNIGGGGIYMWHGVHDQVWRHCSKRNSAEGADLDESSHGISVEYAHSSQMIFDHMSMSWASDGQWHVYMSPDQKGTMENFTLSNSIIAAGDANPERPNGVKWESSQGAMCLGNSPVYRPEKCSFLNNYFAHSATRNPAIWTASGEMIGNIVYNWEDHAVTAYDIENPAMGPHPLGAEAWIENNLMKRGPQKGTGPVNFTNAKGGHQNNYYIKRLSEGVNKAREVPGKTRGRARYPKTIDTYEDIRELASSMDTPMMQCIGASRPSRDAIDRQYLQDFYDGSGQIFNSVQPEKRDLTIYSASVHPQKHDTDKDGIADDWELRWVDSIKLMDHTTDCDGDGYTDLEEYINELAQCQIVK